ncbi:MAG: right-handed parallel beta-helix repeat-containing protein [Oscillospiraceae bacterium]|jgi:hypothetical protein|nr:right-handed parallel beta-helix repeat-containing protein [Oscillospiraceae bacterium]
MEYHVAKNAALNSIAKAAELAHPGDIVTVHEGIYREWVNPRYGGGEGSRITYQAAEGEDVTISGAEVVTEWMPLGGHIWWIILDSDAFGGFNPYREIIWGDWFFDTDKGFHLGEVYYDDIALREDPASTTENLGLYRWRTETTGKKTLLYANFGDKDPRDGKAEVNVRKYVFFPEKTGCGYITVRGFKLTKAATQWAPPTALQEGLIGPHWSKGWIIENNEISHSKCVGVSLGKDISTGHNEWSRFQTKQGTQREREVIFRALKNGWTRDNIGSHVVRNNTIRDCEQAGVVGHLGAAFSIIDGNHIYNIHEQRLWGGAEIAGIKLHAALDTLIRGNTIHSAYRGVWLDWQAQGTRLSRNVFFDNSSEDFFVEVSHGPYLADHNLFLSAFNYKEMAQGGALVHNLFIGKNASTVDNLRYTPYHFPHDTAVAGVANIAGGDVRVFNNLFVGDADVGKAPYKANFWDGAPEMDGLPAMTVYTQYPIGTSCYNEYPIPGDPPQMFEFGVEQKLPVYVADNAYVHGAVPLLREAGAVVTPGEAVTVTIDREKREIKIECSDVDALRSGTRSIINTEILGEAFQAEQGYTDTYDSPIVLNRDFNDLEQSEHDIHPCAGPFERGALDKTFMLTVSW